MRSHSILAALLAVSAAASPLKNRAVATVTVSGSTATSYPQPVYEIEGFPIHRSCNGTERAQLEKALGDTIKIAQQAAKHIYAHGNSSDLYTKYFGSAPTAEVIGWYEKVVYGNRDGILFRCDDIDGNCHQDGISLPSLPLLKGFILTQQEKKGWGGHWRGENATLETVICPLSYSTRQPLEALCGGGYTVANGALNHYFAADLLHRLYHVTSIGEGAAEHYADTYTECLELAQANASEAVRNSHTLQYFALDVYAVDVALPGEGCTGKPDEEAEHSHAAPAATSSSLSSVASATSSVSSAAATSAAATSAAVTSAAASSTSVEAASQTASKTSSAAAVSPCSSSPLDHPYSMLTFLS